MTIKHPIQPIVKDKHGVYRFKDNAIVRYLLDNGGIDLNHLAIQDFPNADRVQFAQLIGYSVSGFGELSYVDDDSYDAAVKLIADGTANQSDVRLEVAEAKLEKTRLLVAELVSLLGVREE